MKLFLTISLWLFIAFQAFAEPIAGASYIGMCNPNFPCDKALELKPQAIGYLADAFGRRCDCVRKALLSPELQYVRVHISNGTCFPERGRVCDKFDVFQGETQQSARSKILLADRRIYRRFLTALNASMKLLEGSGKEIRYSPMMESPFSSRVRQRLLSIVEAKVGKERTVDSVVSQKCINGYVCEKHGDSLKFPPGSPCIADLDGTPLFKADIESLKRSSEQCEAIFYWTMGFNLLPYWYTGEFIAPWKRKHKAQDWELEGLKQCLESH